MAKEITVHLSESIKGRIKIYGSNSFHEDQNILSKEDVNFLHSISNKESCTKSEYQKVMKLIIEIGARHPEVIMRKRAIQDLVMLIQHSYEQLSLR